MGQSLTLIVQALKVTDKKCSVDKLIITPLIYNLVLIIINGKIWHSIKP